MVRFNVVIQKFDQMGEKSGWTYISITEKIIEKLKPGQRKSFRVKGRLDHHGISGVALLPMGDGSFIMALNADMRKSIRKRKGDKLTVELETDEKLPPISSELLECLADDPQAKKYFEGLLYSHRLYFSKWIESAKTETTKAKRIAMAVSALAKGWGFPQMLRAKKDTPM